MNPLALNPSDAFLVDLVAKGALLMAIAFAITFVLKRASAALRHAVWSLAFLGLLLLPFCTALLPSWQVAVPGLESGAQLTGVRATAVAPRESAPVPAAVTSQLDPASPALQVAPVADEAEAPAWTWAGIALLVWIGGAIAFLTRLALVLAKLSLLRRLAVPVSATGWLDRAGILADRLDIRRPVRLLQHEEIVVPMTYGVRRPVILLPDHAKDWTDEEMHVTLMHELLHVKRFDHLVHLVALSARALHWFNPLAWVATKRLVIERERACDDGVLSMGVASTSYANHLLEIARDVLSGREASVAALAMARPTELRTRIVAILDPAQPRRTLSRLRMAGMTACSLLLVGSLAAMQPGRADDTDVTANTSALDYSVPDADDDVAEAEPQAAFGEEGSRIPADDEKSDAPRASAPIATDESDRPREQVTDTTEVETQQRALHAISELPRERGIPLLTEVARTHRNPVLRQQAVFWLGQIGDESVAELLESFAREDANPDVQEKAIFALSELRNERGIPRLMDLARTHPSEDLRGSAVFWLGEGGGADVADELATFARSDASQEVQKKAIFALAQLENGAGVSHLIDLTKSHSNSGMRSEAIFWLGETGDPRAADVLMDIVNGN